MLLKTCTRRNSVSTVAASRRSSRAADPDPCLACRRSAHRPLHRWGGVELHARRVREHAHHRDHAETCRRRCHLVPQQNSVAARRPRRGGGDRTARHDRRVTGWCSRRRDPGRRLGLPLQPLHDLAATLVYCAQASDVRTTIVEGNVLMRDRRLTTIDREALLTEFRQRASALTARSHGRTVAPSRTTRPELSSM
jgi:hypothetical protein